MYHFSNNVASKLRVLADGGTFLGIFLGITMENSASWLARRIFLRVSRISISQAQAHKNSLSTKSAGGKEFCENVFVK